ncbi:NAD(P)H-dependent oxidoreductase [Bradyrhizobium sp. CCGUVB23]|uniref:NAD(P)H-dependent oxidoreductase n=1 Tax=Bradyrhizobium sp. CCGUVB23 TaxID=2949630 RepID=UPI0020B3F595|nr:NAD(P)H-dependent oxidoreductase [Bradyrhizobium sp. CCGUVB23]MCP3463332.1 NAD(P)H-dependent oxidoreductase [Bradyrhizobium sp. CCGUVB23]
MHVLFVDGHPDRSEQRFCHALAAAYAEGARQSGNDVRIITIAKLNVPVPEIAGQVAQPNFAFAPGSSHPTAGPLKGKSARLIVTKWACRGSSIDGSFSSTA